MFGGEFLYTYICTMANELNSEVDAYLKRILPQAKKELTYIKNEDWSIIENVKMRGNVYKIQNLLVDRNTKTAVKLYGLAKEDITKKRVKSALSTLIEFFNIADKRYKVMVETFDWSTFSLDNDADAGKIKSEVEFQAEVLNDINGLEARLRAINFGGESDELSINFYNNTPAPFMMAEAIEIRYPEIKQFMKRKGQL